jgi:plasmid stabilization system protein ParE
LFLDHISQKEDCGDLLRTAIRQQGRSPRIGTFEEGSYYVIQGLIGVEYDDRVTRVLTLDNCPKYAVHMTRAEIARSIWSKAPTESTKSRPSGRPILPGYICMFLRAVHAVTNVCMVDGKFRLTNTGKDVRDRMTHGIMDTRERKKYESGLVIDVERLVQTLPSGTVRSNEIGTLLVSDDIPPECLIHIIDSDEDLDAFWNVVLPCA